MSLRFIIYRRVSTDEQAEQGSGLETQEIECRAFVTRLGGTVVGMEEDPGISGKIYPRPGISNALRRLHAREADALIALRVNRLGRKGSVPHRIWEEIQEMGCRLFTVEDGEVTDNAILFFAVRTGMAQSEYHALVENMKGGKRRMAEKGRQPHRSMSVYGYKIVKKIEAGQVREDAGTYQIIEAEARVIETIFRRCSEGASLLGLAKELQRAGVPCANPSSAWWSSTIRHILRNSTYKGEAVWGKTKSITIEGKRRKVPTDPSQRLVIHVPPIVTPELWEECQQRLEENKGDGTRADRRHLLSGLVVCSTCGRKAVVGRTCARDKSLVYYRCKSFAPSSSAGGVVCNIAKWYEHEIVTVLRKIFFNFPNDPDFVLSVMMASIERQAAELNPVEEEDLKNVIIQWERLQSALTDTEINARLAGRSVEEINRRQDDTATKLRDAQCRLGAIEKHKKVRSPQQYQDVVVEIMAAANSALDILEGVGEATEAERNASLRAMIERIVPTGKKSFDVFFRAEPELAVSKMRG